MLRISNIKTKVKHTQGNIKKEIAEILKMEMKDVPEFTIAAKSIDAINKGNVIFVYAVDIELENEHLFLELNNVRTVEEYKYSIEKITTKAKRPIVVGSGPAGIFAALVLAEAGLKPIKNERGKKVEERKKKLDDFFEKGVLNTESNVQFGEGGAGTFSDGKLTTNVNNDKIKKIINELIAAGAPEEIAYLSKPHVGTDKLIDVLKKMRRKIEELGGEYRFCNKLISVTHKNEKIESVTIESTIDKSISEIETDAVILALGHSSRDTIEMLYNNKINIEAKPFSVGVRIEHKQEMVNNSQYGKFASLLPAADYKLNTKLKNGRGVYTFCMCPGGVVVPSASEEGRLVVNGMSYYSRDLENANSAVLVNVEPKDFGNDSPLAGIEFQRRLEEAAYKLGGGNYKAPVQLVGDFLENKKSTKLGNVKPSYSIGYTLTNLSDCLPDFIVESIREGIVDLDRKLRGFMKYDSLLTGVESRSSSPVRIIRDDKMFSNIKGIIPCGEGAGYAGGIMSAAVDGIKCAESVHQYYKEQF